jgi:hypothetical protein
MKRHSYPHFSVVGIVSAYEHGSSRPDIEVKAGCYISFHDEAYSALIRDAKWRLERLGMPKERIDAMYFEGVDIIERNALDAIGVRRVFGDRVDAFLDYPELKKRDVLIRQRRLVPHDQRDMLEIYGPKVAAAASTAATDEAVAA